MPENTERLKREGRASLGDDAAVMVRDFLSQLRVQQFSSCPAMQDCGDDYARRILIGGDGDWSLASAHANP